MDSFEADISGLIGGRAPVSKLPAGSDPESLVARIIAELRANPDAQRLLLQALLTNEFLGMPARLDRIEKDVAELKIRVEAGFDDLRRAIDRLGGRWGIRDESLFRQTMAAVLQESFCVSVEQRTFAGEQFDLLIFDGQHLLVEIAASVGPSITQRLQRKRRLYAIETG